MRVLEQTGVRELVLSSLQRGDKKPPISGVEVYAAFIRESVSFGEAEQELLEIFGVRNLRNPELWQLLIGAEKGSDLGHPVIMETYRGLNFISDALPKVIAMLRRSFDEPSSGKSSGNAPYDGFDRITVILLEGSQPSTPERISVMLKSISGFYDVFAELEDPRGIKLSVVGCDSGSDKSFDFLGAAKVVEGVKELILTLWDRVVFYRESKAGKNLDLIAASLPVIERISQLENGGTLGPEKAEILRRKVGECVGGFVQCGAIIPEIEERKTHEPRLLMQPEVKLLAPPLDAPMPPSSGQIPSPSPSSSSIDGDVELNEFLRKKAEEFLNSRNPKKRRAKPTGS